MNPNATYGACKDWLQNNATKDVIGVCEIKDCEDRAQLLQYMGHDCSDSMVRRIILKIMKKIFPDFHYTYFYFFVYP